MRDAQPTRAFLRLATFYVATFAVLGVYMQYFPVWLHDERGLGLDDVTFVLSGQIVARTIAGPLWAQHVDRRGRPARVLCVLLALSLAAFGCFLLAHERIGLLLCSAAFGCAYPPLHPILDNLALQTAHAQGFVWTRVRLWGSLSFLVVIVLVGELLQHVSSAWIYWLVVGGLVASFAGAWLLPEPPRGQPEAAGAPAGAPVGRLLRQPAFVAFLVASALLQGSHGAYYSLSTLHWRAHGIDEGTAGWLWAEGVLGEIALFFWVRDRAERLRPTTLLLLGGAGAVVRWAVLGATTSVAWIVAVNWLHAASFGCTFLGALRFIRLRVAPEMQATAQGLLGAASSGVGMALATLLAGRLYERHPGGAFLAMAGLAGLGGGVALALRRRRPVQERRE